MNLVQQFFDLRPAAIVKELNLLRPITSYKLIALDAGPLTIGITTAAYAILPLFTALLQEPDIRSGNYSIHWLERWLARHYA